MENIKVISKEEMDKQFKKQEVARIAEELFFIHYKKEIRPGETIIDFNKAFPSVFENAEAFFEAKMNFVDEYEK